MLVRLDQAASVADRLRKLRIEGAEIVFTPLQSPEQEILVRQIALGLPPQRVGFRRRNFVFCSADRGSRGNMLPLAGGKPDLNGRVQRRVLCVPRCSEISQRRFSCPGALCLLLGHQRHWREQCRDDHRHAQIHSISPGCSVLL